MKKGLIVTALLLITAILLPSCGSSIVPEETDTESESAETFTFESQFIPHGEIDLRNFKAEDAQYYYDSLFCLEGLRPAANREEYERYIDEVCSLLPDADREDFPDIPAEWFEDHALLTVLLSPDGVTGEFSGVELLAKANDGGTLFLFMGLEGIESTLIASAFPPIPAASYLAAFDKSEAEELTAVCVKEFIYGSKDKYRSKAVESTNEAVESGYLRLDQKVCSWYTECAGRRDDLPAYMEWDKDAGLVYDDNHEDVLFSVRVTLSVADLPFEGFADAEKDVYRTFWKDYGIEQVFYEATPAAYPTSDGIGELSTEEALAENLYRYIYIPCTAPLLKELIDDPRVAEIDP